MKPKIIQIETGTYTYYDRSGNQHTGHYIYGLDEHFQVWKFLPTMNKWKMLEEASEEYIKERKIK